MIVSSVNTIQHKLVNILLLVSKKEANGFLLQMNERNTYYAKCFLKKSMVRCHASFAAASLYRVGAVSLWNA